MSRLFAAVACLALLLPACERKGEESDLENTVSKSHPYAFHTPQDSKERPVADNGALLSLVSVDVSGAKVVPAIAREGWSLTLRTSSFGRAGRTLDLSNPKVGTRDQRATLSYGQLTAYFDNKPAGLEQGWELPARPEGDGPIRITVTADGLTFRPGDKDSILLGDARRPIFEYRDLRVWDADRKPLGATMSILAPHAVEIVVDDTGARYPVTIDPTLVRIGQDTSSDGMSADRFGAAIAVADDLALVGAPANDAGAADSGAVYVFRRTGGVWAEVQKLVPPDPSAGKRFGESVAVLDGVALVGAPGDDENGADAGAAYAFEGGSPAFGTARKLLPPAGAAGDRAGTSTAISNIIIGPDIVPHYFVGAPGHDSGGTDRGAVFEFIPDANSGDILPGSAIARPTAVDGEGLGSAIVASSDVDQARLYIGASHAPGDPSPADRGAVFIFERNVVTEMPLVTDWPEFKRLDPSDGLTGDEFGHSIALFADRLVVGAPSHGGSGAVYVFDRNLGGDDEWGQLAKVTDSTAGGGARFGHAIGYNAGLLAVGAPMSGSGAVTLHSPDQGGTNTWGIVTKVSSPTAQAGDEFGFGVGLSAQAIFGAPNEGSIGRAHFYDLSGEPIAADDSYSVEFGETLTVAAPGVLANDADPDAKALSAILVTNTSSGNLNLASNGGFTFAPAQVGVVSFVYKANNGSEDSNQARATITVTSPNEAPVAVDDVATTPRDTAVTIDVLANDSDPEGDPITLDSVNAPMNGTAVVINGLVRYTPEAGFAGQDHFNYVISAAGQTDSGQVVVNVTSANQPPTARMDTVITNEETAVQISPLANDTDPENDALTLGTVDQPANGSISVSGSTVTYTPNNNFSGFDLFDYRVTDAAGNLAVGTIRVAVQEIPDPPVANDDNVMTTKSMAITIDVLANDVDPDSSPLVQQVTQPSNGSAVISQNKVIYTPTPLWTGTDSFTYTIQDNALLTDTATVTVVVGDANLLPEFVPPTPITTVRGAVGDLIQFRVIAIDGDPGTTISYGMLTPPTGASVDSSTGNFSWTTNASHAGTTTLTFTASDGIDTVTKDVFVQLTFDDDDGDGVSDGWERGNGLDPNSRDSDGDEIPDGVEVGFEPSQAPDTDGDMVIDALDDDSDGDGVLDIDEAGDDDLDTDPVDTDGDGIFDFRDTDSDNDGTDDGADNCRLDANADQADLDGDGRGDVCDPDRDGDNLADEREPEVGLDPDNPDTDGDFILDGDELGSFDEPRDSDGDMTHDALDDDSDGDGYSDAEEAGDEDPFTRPVDTDGDGVPDFRDIDSDNDNALDAVDNCLLVNNPTQNDTDGDGEGDACDETALPDGDGDGVHDAVDGCPDVADPEQINSDGDEFGDACDDDDDNDTILDPDDNCPIDANEDQADNDDDGDGDECDPDDDDDGVPDGDDNCPEEPNTDQADDNEDGIGNACQGSVVNPDPEPEGCCKNSVAGRREPFTLWLLAVIGLAALVRRRL